MNATSSLRTNSMVNPATRRVAPRSRPDFPTLATEDLERYSITEALKIAGGLKSHRGTREGELNDALGGFAQRALRGHRHGHAFSVPLTIRGALDGSTSGEGEELVFVRPGSFVDGIRARSVVGSLGATVQESPLPLREPRLDEDAGVSWIGEDPGSDMPDAQPTFGSVEYSLHTLAVSVPYSRQLLTESMAVGGVDRIVARAAEAAFAAEWDRVAIQGSGTSNEPTGILGTSGIGVVPIAADGGAPTYAHVVGLEHEVAVDDADTGVLGFATTPGVRQKLRTTEQFAGAGPVWRGSRVLGYPSAVSTNVPSDLTKGTGTDLHAIIFGNWADLVVTMLPVLDVVVDPYSLKKQGIIEAVYFLYLDVQLRHAESFAAVVDADPTA